MEVGSLLDLVRRPPVAGPAPGGTFEDLAGMEDLQVLDVALDVARSEAGILLEGRQSEALGAGNAAVLTAHDVSALRWSRAARTTRVHAFRVVAGGVAQQGPGTTITIECEPYSDLVVTATSISLHVVRVPGLPEAPVDYSADDDAIRAGTPSWTHAAEVLASWQVLP